jgi:hypothetical protein
MPKFEVSEGWTARVRTGCHQQPSQLVRGLLLWLALPDQKRPGLTCTGLAQKSLKRALTTLPANQEGLHAKSSAELL